MSQYCWYKSEMNIVEARFEILTPESELRDQLLRIEKAGRTCYQSEKGPITEDSAGIFASKIMSRNHMSVIEHSAMTVKFFGLSRGFTHELVRHRLAAYSQESTRYVDYAKEGDELIDLDRFQMEMVFPPHKDVDKRVDLGDGRSMSPREMAQEIETFYRGLRKAEWLAEDARQILPTGLVADIVMTANFREWRHVFEMRTQKAAHWEIRGVMVPLLQRVQVILPPLFGDFEKAGEDKNGLAFYEIKRRGG